MNPKFLPVVIGICAWAIAQDRPAIPTGNDSATAISLAEAEQHLIERKPPVYPALAKAARITGHRSSEVAVRRAWHRNKCGFR